MSLFGRRWPGMPLPNDAVGVMASVLLVCPCFVSVRPARFQANPYSKTIRPKGEKRTLFLLPATDCSLLLLPAIRYALALGLRCLRECVSLCGPLTHIGIFKHGDEIAFFRNKARKTESVLGVFFHLSDKTLATL